MINNPHDDYDVIVAQSNNPIDKEHTGLYIEVQIINYLDELIYITDYNNSKSVIEPIIKNGSNPSGNIPFVEIQMRNVKGQRKFTTDYYRQEIWKGNLVTIRISYDKLLEKPIYVKELDLVISINAHNHKALHPRSESIYDINTRKIYEELKESMTKPSIAIIANDATCGINILYCILNGEIITINVTNHIYEKSVFKIIYRNALSDIGYKTVEYDFNEIVGSGGCFILKDKIPFFVHEDLTTVKHKYNQWLRKEASKLDIQAQEIQLKELIKQYEIKLKNTEEKYKTQELKFREDALKDKHQIEEYEQRCAFYRTQLDQIIEIQKLENAQRKMHYENTKYIHQQKLDKSKLKAQTNDNLFGLSTNMIKLLVVTVPIVSGIISYIVKEKLKKN